MRPGSPVKPLHTVPAHIEDEDEWHRRIYGDAVGFEVPPVSSVWVAVAVWTKAVVVQDRRNVAATGQLGQGVGRTGIFAAASTPVTQESFAAEVVAVTLTRDEADRAVEEHRRSHGAESCEYKVGEHPIGIQDSGPTQAQEAVRTPCIKCGTLLSDGTSFCQPCRKEMFDAQKDADPGDVEVARRNTYTPPQDRSGVGRGM